MPASKETGSAFTESSDDERILFTSESVGEGHPGEIEHFESKFQNNKMFAVILAKLIFMII